MTRPPCYNRPPPQGRWLSTGRYVRGKHIYRWVRPWLEDRCATHGGVGIGSNGETYPQPHGWNCAGCRLDPHRVIHTGVDPGSAEGDITVRTTFKIDPIDKMLINGIAMRTGPFNRRDFGTFDDMEDKLPDPYDLGMIVALDCNVDVWTRMAEWLGRRLAAGRPAAITIGDETVTHLPGRNE